jgi:integrase
MPCIPGLSWFRDVRQDADFVPILSRATSQPRSRITPECGSLRHVYRRSAPRGDAWYAKYRLPDGRQVHKRIGPAWTSRGRPAAGYFTKRTAESWLRDLLDEARRGTLPGMVRTGATFADAAAEYLRWIEHDRARKPSTVRDYHSIIKAHVLPAFGDMRLEDITTEGVERWAAGLTVGGRMNNRTKLKIITVLHGVMKRAKRVWKLPRNPITDVEKPVQTQRIDIDIFSPEDIMALVRAAASEQDAAIYLTAAFTGLRRGELVALRWRDVDFARRHVRVTARYTERSLTTPKSGKVRSVPLAPVVAEELAGGCPPWRRLGRSWRWMCMPAGRSRRSSMGSPESCGDGGCRAARPRSRSGGGAAGPNSRDV